MTRNSLDDLFITYHIFIIYIEFLEKRTKDELMIIQKEYLKNDTLPDSTNITPHISIISDGVPRL